jgi:hypothetical protein
MIDLAAGEYVTTMSPVLSVENFLKEMAATYHATTFAFKDDTIEKVGCGSEGAFEVAFDEKMARLAIDNAVANAVAHGDLRRSVTLRASLVVEGSKEDEGGQ